jgi:hypothetical protein
MKYTCISKLSLTNLNLSFDMFQRSMLHFNFIEISISFLLKQSINGMQHHTFISNSILFCQKKSVFKWCIIVTVINIKLKGPTLSNLQHIIFIFSTTNVYKPNFF